MTYETFGTPKQEIEYISPDEISQEAIAGLRAWTKRH